MRRVQVIIEDWQYQYLRDLAARKKTAISAELRQIIDRAAAVKAEGKDALFETVGIAAEAKSEYVSSENIDDRLYREKK